MNEMKDMTWDEIYACIDTILDGDRLEETEGKRARIIRLKWDYPDEHEDVALPVVPRPSSSRDRRYL